MLLLPLLLFAAGGAGYAIGRTNNGTTGSTLPVSSPVPGETASPIAGDLARVEVGFPVDMLDHHDQIVEVASYASAHATSDMVRSLANMIVASQQYEKGLLESYLRAQGFERPERDGRMSMGWMGAPIPLDLMPGYLPKSEVIDFYNLSGADLDRRFLELTVRHHEGGIHMAEVASMRSTDPWLRSLADLMVTDQRTEINDATAALGSSS